jgi:hypothetical protein
MFKLQSVNFTFFDTNQENSEIKDFTDTILRQESNSLLSYLFLDEDYVFDKVHEEFKIVSSVKISKNFHLGLNVVISKNQEFFYTCVPEESNFLVKCMKGNLLGEYYSGMTSETSGLVNIEIDPKVLFDTKTSKKIEEPDSLSGSRIYNLEDFKVLREILRWVQKNGFQIKKVYVGELKIVDIYTDFYKIKISLDKSFVDTVKDFETISKTGNLQKYINDDKEKISYIDLSYRNKVFYKLKSDEKNNFENATKTDIMSTTSSSTYAKEFLDRPVPKEKR